jgi:hypothetical protein
MAALLQLQVALACLSLALQVAQCQMVVQSSLAPVSNEKPKTFPLCVAHAFDEVVHMHKCPELQAVVPARS